MSAVVLLLLAAVPLVLALTWRHPSLAWTIGIVSYLLPLTQFAVGETRFVLLVAAAWLALRSLTRPAETARQSLPRQGKFMLMSMASMTSIFAVSLFWTVSLSSTVAGLVAWLGLLVALPVFFGAVGPKRFGDATLAVLLTLLAISALVALSRLPTAFEGNRVVGVMNNANGLGVLCALSAPWVAARLSNRTGAVLVVLVLALAVATGSRAGALAAVLGCLVVWFLRSTRGSRFLWVLGGSVAAAITWNLGDILRTADWSIARTNNSREDIWAAALTSFRERPWLGHGFNTLEQTGGSSYIRALAEVGVLGSSLIGVSILRVASAIRSVPGAAGVGAAGLANAGFESWLLSAGSGYLMVFVVGLMHFDRSTGEPKGMEQ